MQQNLIDAARAVIAAAEAAQAADVETLMCRVHGKADDGDPCGHCAPSGECKHTGTCGYQKWGEQKHPTSVSLAAAPTATVKDSLIVQQAQAVPDGFVLVQRSPDKAVCLDGGRFHGWLMYRHPDGQFVSERKLQPWEVKEAGARLAAEAKGGSDANH